MSLLQRLVEEIGQETQESKRLLRVLKERLDKTFEEQQKLFKDDRSVTPIQCTIKVYTDGCRKKNESGGWCSLIVETDGVTLLGGYHSRCTNNQMEIQPFIAALELLKNQGKTGVELISDSRYVVDGFTSWMHTWRSLGWQRKEKGQLKEVKNLSMWMELFVLKKATGSKASWVRGHAGHRENELCDKIANHCCYRASNLNKRFSSMDELMVWIELI